MKSQKKDVKHLTLEFITYKEDNKMKSITAIEMATDNDILEITFGSSFTKKSVEGGFCVYQNNEEINWLETEEEADDFIKQSAIDSDLTTSGYGINSGKKFWQLTEALQKEILAKACKY